MDKRKLTPLARQLRKQATKEEQMLWHHLRSRQLGWKFRRQAPLCGYIVDFVCFDQKVIIELDGSQHAQAAHRMADEKRDEALRAAGFRVLRFWNHQVRESIDAVLEHIYEVCNNR